MNNQKTEKPVLQGQRIKTRKRDEKEKYEPIIFRDSFVYGLKGAGIDLDSISKYLDTAANKLDYRRYGEVVFDVLLTGGMLAPGGGMVDGAEKAQRYLFLAKTDDEIKAFYGVILKLIRRYKYLEKSFEDEISKLIMFLRSFSLVEQKQLAQFVGICMAHAIINHSCLTPLFNNEEHLVKDGLALSFATDMFAAWIKEKDGNNISTSLRRAGFDEKLLNLCPMNKRTTEHFCKHFKDQGLNSIAEFQISKASQGIKKQLGSQLSDMIEEEINVNEVIAWLKSESPNSGLSELELVSLVWTSVINGIEWNKKEEMIADQALKYLKKWSLLFKFVCSSPKAELTLMRRCQEYCYENMDLMKSFYHIIIQFYKCDVLDEDTILKWYKDGHLPKGKSIFLEQMKKFIEWLNNAETESDDEEK